MAPEIEHFGTVVSFKVPRNENDRRYSYIVLELYSTDRRNVELRKSNFVVAHFSSSFFSPQVEDS